MAEPSILNGRVRSTKLGPADARARTARVVHQWPLRQPERYPTLDFNGERSPYVEIRRLNSSGPQKPKVGLLYAIFLLSQFMGSTLY